MVHPRLGFIGIGFMGEAMTRRLLDCGWQVTAWNLEPERLDLVTPHGAAGAASPAQVADAADIILMCVLDTHAVRNCVFGPNGIAAARDVRGKLLVDLSTIDPTATREMAAELARTRDFGWLDCPVSGGPPAARDGSLAIMVGGAAEHVERARAVLADLGSNVTHMGPCGAGQTTKIINQAIVGAGFALMSEAALLAEASGIDAQRLPDCLAGGFADSTLLRKLYPRIHRRDFEPPSATARQLLKDLQAVAAFAREHDCPSPVVDAAAERYATYVASGHALDDSASLIRLYESETMERRGQLSSPNETTTTKRESA